MTPSRLLVVQFLAILVIVLGFLTSDQPDSLSVMHFNPDSSVPSVFSKAPRNPVGVMSMRVVAQSNTGIPGNHTPLKHISFKLILPDCISIPSLPISVLRYSTPLSHTYDCQFTGEINLPPPELA